MDVCAASDWFTHRVATHQQIGPRMRRASTTISKLINSFDNTWRELGTKPKQQQKEAKSRGDQRPIALRMRRQLQLQLTTALPLAPLP